MASRRELFTKENLEVLHIHSPFLLLFQKKDWQEYLELIARIYDQLETVGRVDFETVAATIDDFYSQRDLSSVLQKRIQFVSMAISELGVLRDSHDSSGKRFIEATRDGKGLLKFCEGLILNRRKFVGSGADTLLGALNSLLAANATLSVEEAIAAHKKKIAEYELDIDRITEHGVEASEILTPGLSAEELFTQAEDAASHILSAGEDIKLAVENVRRDLVSRYRQNNFSVGQAIEYVADFYEALRLSPEFASFSRAKDILSFIEGLSGNYQHRDVSRIFHRLRETQAVSDTYLNRSSLEDFSRRFQSIVRSIDEKIQEQLSILRTQVHYVLMGDSRRVQSELNECLAVLTEHRSQANEFLESVGYTVQAGIETGFGALQLHSLESDSEALNLDELSLTQIDDSEMATLMELLRKAEEATIQEVLERLRDHLSRYGEAKLSTYKIDFGIIEFYVLSHIEHFCEHMRAEKIGRCDLAFAARGKEFIVPQVDDVRISYVA